MKISDDMLYKYAAEARDIWLDTLPQYAKVPDHEFSRKFQKRMRKLIAEQWRSAEMNAFVRFAKRAAVILVIIISVTFSSMMTVEAYREKFIRIITQAVEDLTNFQFLSDDSLPDAFTPVCLGYLPAGMKETEREQTLLKLYIHFEDDQDMILDITQTHLSADTQSSMILDTEDADVQHFILQGEEAISTSKKGVHTIIFTKNHYIFVLYSNLPMDELRRVAEQVIIN